MIPKIVNAIVGYHYTNARAYRSMQTPGIDGYTSGRFNTFKGMIPRKRFIRYGWGKDLPEVARDGIIEGLLEPEPPSWMANSEFPGLWGYLMHDICREKDVMLLRFDILPQDDAYVVDRAHIERELYREGKGLNASTKESMQEACERYWKSRVPVKQYAGGYAVPQLAIWSGIPLERLQIVWTRPTEEVWSNILKMAQ